MVATRPTRHPFWDSYSIAEELVAPVADQIRRTAAEAEAMRRLPNDLMALLEEAGLLSIYTPKQFGGFELPVPEALRVVEEVARHDGSTAWIVALSKSSNNSHKRNRVRLAARDLPSKSRLNPVLRMPKRSYAGRVPTVPRSRDALGRGHAELPDLTGAACFAADRLVAVNSTLCGSV
jgi:Acyl-CoA dehydrogenase, N-terminal domain